MNCSQITNKLRARPNEGDNLQKVVYLQVGGSSVHLGGNGDPKNDEPKAAFRMEFSIVEKFSGPWESIFSLSRRPQLNPRKQHTNFTFYIKCLDLLV